MKKVSVREARQQLTQIQFSDRYPCRHLTLLAISDVAVLGATDMLVTLPRSALRTLDAIHLSVVELQGVRELATADKIMAQAAKARGLRVSFFGPGRF